MGNPVGSAKILTSIEQDIIVGTMLGDGYFERLSSGSVRLVIHHGLAQREYVDSLYEQLRRFMRTPPTVVWAFDRRYGRRRPSYRVRTRAMGEFHEWHEQFYNTVGRKRIPPHIGTLLTPRALAVWFMDDGSSKNDSRGLLINTMAFSAAEHDLLQETLRERFGIPTTLHTLRKWKRIYIPARWSGKFVEIIAPYVPVSMRYKLKRVLCTP